MVRRRDVGLGQGRGGARGDLLEIQPARPRVASARHHDTLQPVHRADQWRETFEPLTVDQQRRGLRILEREGDLRSGPPGVDRHADRADRLAGPEADHPFGIVAHADGDAVAFFHTDCAQMMGEGGDLAEVCVVAQHLLAVDQERPLTVSARELHDRAERRRRVLVDPLRVAVCVVLHDLECPLGGQPRERLGP